MRRPEVSFRRCTGVILVVAAMLAGVAPADAAARSIRLRTRPLKVPAGGETEMWTVLRVRADASLDIAGMVLENRPLRGALASHHLRVFVFRSDPATTLVNQVRRWTYTPGVALEQLQLVGGSQTLRAQQVAPDGLALRLPAARATPVGRRRWVWLVVDSHWFNTGTRTGKAVVELTLLPVTTPIKRYLQPIFEVTASAGIFVEPGTVRSTEDSTRDTNAFLGGFGLGPFEDAWGPGVPTLGPLVSSAGGLPSPRGPACVTFLTAHMHLRGTLFAVDFVDSDDQVRNGDPHPGLANPYEPGRHHLFVSTRYDEPAEIHFDPPRYLGPGQRFHYACWHDNGVTKPPKLSCENYPGLRPGAPAYASDGYSFPCHREGRNEEECQTSGYTGQCVRANLAFGASADDDMCILPGGWFEPNLVAPPGRECDLTLMSPLA